MADRCWHPAACDFSVVRGWRVSLIVRGVRVVCGLRVVRGLLVVCGRRVDLVAEEVEAVG